MYFILDFFHYKTKKLSLRCDMLYVSHKNIVLTSDKIDSYHYEALNAQIL